MRKIKILVVDDDVDICDYMQLVLSQKRYDVTTQSDPTKVLDELKKDEFHVVILDLMMPEINGLELLEEIRGFDRDIAIIIFTGYPSVDTAVMSLRYKVDDYIRKPFDIEAFNDSLERILRENFPEDINEIIDVTDHDAGENPYYQDSGDTMFG